MTHDVSEEGFGTLARCNAHVLHFRSLVLSLRYLDAILQLYLPLTGLTQSFRCNVSTSPHRV